ncbi:MAG: Argininosuccinate lyase [Alphaproteobacteria bacterium MarineAlpha2_Bin1]|nr:MAG: Argininosuccinate lyase [Alphaproteobacteria bacterium MarineAlpha2_Bin1]
MTDKENKKKLMWGGRFSENQDKVLSKINSSIGFDKRLFRQDLNASIAHCEMLIEQDIITKNDGEKILTGLSQISDEFENSNFKFTNDLEDIHTHIEARLNEIIGEPAGRLHTARSRNDQIATDLRLWIRQSIDEIQILIKDLLTSIIKQAETNIDTIMPGLTHLQTAQPITFAHHLLAYFEMFDRDILRFQNCKDRLNESPLGSGAIAGTVFNIDRNYTSKKLGFERPMINSIDAVSSRDFAVEFTSCCSINSMHLSRLSEEIVIWMSEPFSFIILSDSFSTGSSMLPQKRNPDAAELVRAKSGRIFGDLNTLLVVLKGLPLAYSKDLQEDKEAVFDAYDTLKLCLMAMKGMIDNIRANKERMLHYAKCGFSTATDLADWLVINLNLPFREAHQTTGEIIKLAENSNRTLQEISLEELMKINPKIDENIKNVLSVENSVYSKCSFGGTSPIKIKEAIDLAKERIE